MKWLIGLFAACLLSVSSAFALPPVPGVLAAADMEAPPATAVAVTQCNLLVAAYFTLKDGRFVKSDVKDHPTDVSADDVLRWGDTATTGAHRVEVNCDDPANALHRTADLKTPAPKAELKDPKAQGQYVLLTVCGEPVGVVSGDPEGLTIRLFSEVPKSLEYRIVANMREIAKKGGPVSELELKQGCTTS